MFIQTEPVENSACMKFLPGCAVLSSGTANFPDAESAVQSPLAQRLFVIEGVTGVYLDPDSITITKSDDQDWITLKLTVLGAIMDHFTTDQPVVIGQMENETVEEEFIEDEDVDPEIAAKLKDLIETRIRPAVAQEGSDIQYRGFKDGMVLVEIVGSAYSLMNSIQNMLRHYVPEVKGVIDYRDAIPKPGLDTEDGKAIRRLLDERINPQVAGHGGHIALVDVQDDTVYIRLEGGCQGCGMADVTLKQGVATEIQSLVPTITRVLDVTDHAGGTNPYYQPGKGGTSAL